MLKDMNLKVLKKCLLAGIIMMATGMVMQVAKGQLFLQKEPPELCFLISVVIAYIVMGFLYSVVFFLTRHVLPGRTTAAKGLFHSLFASLIVMIPGALGMIAFDFDGGFNLLTSAKIEAYVICLVDVINLGIGGLVLAKLFKNDIRVRQPIRHSKAGLLLSSIVSAVLFPLLMLAMHFLAEMLMPLGLNIPGMARPWYFTSLMLPYILTGGFLPIYYYNVKDAFSGSRISKALSFFLMIYLCYWLINVLFMLPFGYSLQTVIFYLMISIPSLLVVIMLNGYIMSLTRDKAQTR